MKQVKSWCESSFWIYLSLIVLCCPLTTVNGRHLNRRHHRGRTHRHRHSNFKMPSLFGDDVPVPISYHLVLSQTKPTEPPWRLLANESAAPETQQDTLRSGRRLHNQRTKRSMPYEMACEDIGEWVELTHSKDIYGIDVEVLQGINVDGVQLMQYFYETRCIRNNTACKGIDPDIFESYCENKYIWTYGYVRWTQDGEMNEGWRQIQITGSCNCAVRRKASDSQPNVSIMRFL